MPNPYHFRARMDRLWRHANSDAPAYRRLNALDAIVRELYAPTEQARQNRDLCFATDPYDVARHHLRDIYDRPGPMVLASEPSLSPSGPLSLQGEGWGEGPSTEEDTPEEDDDPL